ncbi:protein INAPERTURATE POLLEN1 [Eucalyptus grandis]|uniref:protein INAPERTURATE POLLEN1 n=1 Tax=Eucalyptus grandis TaxID=71139 RepID=UPI00192F0372|nr:protein INAPERTURATE POLLEN1 [Eucalyptus grandis]
MGLRRLRCVPVADSKTKFGAANPFKKTRRFADFYAEWFDALERTLLPLLRDSLSSSSSSSSTSVQLSAAVHALHCHLQSYYSALNLAASSSSADQLPRLLCPPWRNSLERPFLFLGDLHPYVFTTLLRSLLENDGDDSDDEGAGVFLEDDCNQLSGRPWQVLTAWKNPSKHTISRMEQIECGVRLMVPALWDRAKAEQAHFADRVADQWTRASGKKKKETTATVGKAAAAAAQGLAGVFLDANRLRKSVLADIMSATNLYQAGLFLEALAQFLVGLRDPELLEKFQHCPVKMR